MLDTKIYNISELKKMQKEHFYKSYTGKMPDIDKVWDWLHPKKKSKKDK
jgi:hypothetical protein